MTEANDGSLTMNAVGVTQLAMGFLIQPVLDRYIAERGVSRQTAGVVEREMKRYLVLRALHPKLRFPLAAGPVDELWHTFLLFTVPYHEFCHLIAGGFIHHHPGPFVPTAEQIQAAQRDFDSFVQRYRSTFGDSPRPDLWPRIGDTGVRWSC